MQYIAHFYHEVLIIIGPVLITSFVTVKMSDLNHENKFGNNLQYIRFIS